ncbi:MAG: hypothetical protein WBO39_03435 [Ferruginibacter sp.]
MKKMITAICLAATLAACKPDPATAPTAVLDGMFTAMKNGQIDSMKNYITSQDIAMLEAAEKFMTGIDPEGMKTIRERITGEIRENAKNYEYHLKNEKINGDRATVEAEIVSKVPDSTGTTKKTSHTFELVKENDAWKIALSKPGNEMFNSMKGNMGAQKADLKDGLEKLQKMDRDTLKMMLEKAKLALDSIDRKKKGQ